MAEPIPDLLPDQFGQPRWERTPVGILRAQASLMGAKTNNTVLGEVRVYPTYPPGPGRTYAFNLVVPALEDYTYQALRLTSSSPTGYPVILDGGVLSGEHTVSDEPELMAVLRRVFASERFRDVVNSLMSEVHAVTS